MLKKWKCKNVKKIKNIQKWWKCCELSSQEWATRRPPPRKEHVCTVNVLPGPTRVLPMPRQCGIGRRAPTRACVVLRRWCRQVDLWSVWEGSEYECIPTPLFDRVVQPSPDRDRPQYTLLQVSLSASTTRSGPLQTSAAASAVIARCPESPVMTADTDVSSACTSAESWTSKLTERSALASNGTRSTKSFTMLLEVFKQSSRISAVSLHISPSSSSYPSVIWVASPSVASLVPNPVCTAVTTACNASSLLASRRQLTRRRITSDSMTLSNARFAC